MSVSEFDDDEGQISPRLQAGEGREIARRMDPLVGHRTAGHIGLHGAHVADRHHCEDLVQEVAQVVAEGFSEFDRSRSFTAWTLGIARNRILKYYRGQARDRLVLSETALTQLAVAFETIEPQAEHRREALRRCLNDIRGRSRVAIEMRYRDGDKVAHIAQHFSTSPSAISVMFHRVRKALMRCIERQLQSTEG